MKTITRLCLLGIPILFIQCSKDNEPDTNPVSQAEFTIIQNGSDQVITYNSTSNLIFCRDFGDEMWIRLAQSQNSNGDNEPHIDIDLCNYSGPGTYTPINPHVRPCTTPFGWDIWWHGAQTTYANQGNSSPCQLILEINGNVLTGTFNCNDLLQFEGQDTIDITDGSFVCTITN